jgi:hypothetical protein
MERSGMPVRFILWLDHTLLLRNRYWV